ncbi:MAG TPA: DUF4147 domain-containing protein [Longimicrobiaceae bacterium]|nr:DUF4147 domain-containing protein [Longimicrobiaceae bacterium]
MSPREDARRILDAAVAAADAAEAVRRSLRVDGGVLRAAGPDGADPREVDLAGVDGVWVVAAGKAAAQMAGAAEEVLAGRVSGGTVTTRDGHGEPVPGLEHWEASHPVPDTRGLAGAADALRVARGAGERDLLLVLLSGGASALWPSPPPGVSLSDLRTVTARLLRAGATIRELNAVRKHLSRIAGGWLARAAFPARVVTLAVSDVVGSPLDVIASGPTVPDPTTFADALDVLARYEIDASGPVRDYLREGAAGRRPETPKEGDAAFERASTHVVARNRDALEGGAAAAERLGYRARVVAEDLEGEARAVAREIAALVRGPGPGGDDRRPLALLLGGETTVTVRGRGRGGRNQELALALALEIEGREDVVAAALGTDGSDGPTDAAGAIVDGGTVARGERLGLSAGDALARNDSHTFLRATGDLVVTGPTGTNVSDVVLLLR